MEDFNKKIDRSKNDARKWNGRERFFGKADILPMWVADMDIECPSFVVEALKNKADQKIFGYTMEKKEYIGSLVEWIYKRHSYKIQQEKVAHSPTVITTLNYLIKKLTNVGDNILIHTPTYPKFVEQVKMNNRSLLVNKLVEKKEKYEIDFIDFEEKIKKCKLFILCNPHNPTGRVWTKEELEKVGELCKKNNVKIISDEIHSDLIINGKHIPLASLNKDLEEITYTCYSTTKTFNLAGIQSSFAVFPTIKEKKEFIEGLSLIGIHEPNSFCMDMVISAYNNGEKWLEELILHLKGNLEFAINYIEKNIPKLKVKKPEGTYLLWLDMRSYKLSDEELNAKLVNKGKLGLKMGAPFMVSGFARLNVACPRYMLEDGLERLKRAMK